MKRLITVDLKDYDENMPRIRRPSVRGIIISEDKLAMIHSLKYDYYKFPGGGIENGESHIETLIREVAEETGLTVISQSVEEFGSVLRIQRSLYAPESIFEQENFYYTCKTEEAQISQKLDDYEKDERFTLEFVEPQKVIETNRSHDHFGYDEALIEREALVAEKILEKRM